ncbi:hypothetical protein DHEL01_v204847 [Diaporthe helianthi]|uniref:Uncharacterized protein n=1 Tax=Diaporthe helianthi TaxID=158607 RepID=A0A2P5I2R3_DIAHE|nr:hypothetical protein DHEL01_v204847 [Diaporthe helianthi]
MSKENNPNSPTSSLSKKARLAHWITGGTNRGPSTMSSFVRMTRDRNDMKKATKAWSLASERGLDEHQGQWGKSGLMGTLDQMQGTAPRPRGAALIRWFRAGGGGSGGGDGDDGVGRHEADRGDAGRQPEMQQRAREGQVEAGPVEDDIYGAGDNAQGQTAEGDNIGDGDRIERIATGEGVGQRPLGGGGHGHQARGCGASSIAMK